MRKVIDLESLHGWNQVERIALVTCYPPGKRPLSEYGWHLVQGLKKHQRLKRIFVLADRIEGEPEVAEEGPGVKILRCWDFDGRKIPLQLWSTLKKLNVDVVWSNQHLTSTGDSRLSRFLGAFTPLFLRLTGHKILVTLHNMLGLTDMGRVGMTYNRMDVLGARIATWMVGRSNAVTVLLNDYASILKEQYGVRNVNVVPHGTLGDVVSEPTPNNDKILLALGHFGTYKKLEPLLDAMEDLAKDDPPVRLHIAGPGSHHTQDYMSQIRKAYGHLKNVEYLGYVEEKDIPDLFKRSTAVVLPYGTITGASGVMLQAAAYGKPVIASDIPGFRILERDGMRIRFFRWMDCEDLKRQIRTVVSCSQMQYDDALHNLNYCRRQTMDKITDQYLEIMDTISFEEKVPVGKPAFNEAS
jgi:glycosyltransferase involved in cell wall biosynthesis